MPYGQKIVFTINNRRGGSWNLPCDGGVTRLLAKCDYYVGWNRGEVRAGAAAATTIKLSLIEYGFFSDDYYASETFTVSPVNTGVPFPGGIPGRQPGWKYTKYTARFDVFCTKFGCIVNAQDRFGAIGGHGESDVTFEMKVEAPWNFFPSYSGSTVDVICCQNVTTSTYTASTSLIGQQLAQLSNKDELLLSKLGKESANMLQLDKRKFQKIINRILYRQQSDIAQIMAIYDQNKGDVKKQQKTETKRKKSKKISKKRY